MSRPPLFAVATALTVAAGAGCADRSAAPADAGPTCAQSCGAWRSVGHLPVPRMQAAAAVRGGKVYVIGGQVANDQPLPRGGFAATAAVDIYDPVTATWSAGPPLPADAPKNHLAVAVLNDVIFVLSGYVGPDAAVPVQTPTNVAYMLVDAGWRRLPDFPELRGAGATAQAIGGKLYVAGGGTDETAPLADTYVFDPPSSVWSKLAPLPRPRTHVASCAFAGTMIVFGGFDASSATLASTDIFDPAAGPSGTWRAGPDMATARGAASAVALASGCYALGGFRWTDPIIQGALERFDPTAAAWSPLAPLAPGRHSIALAPLGVSLYAFGGSPVPFAGASDSVDLFTP